jgi:demethylmenaquinone methyltransferase/2-methoxy-6-polyprenyl-1,4-benzoquinol methylase
MDLVNEEVIVKPYQDNKESKKEQVEQMFNNIAHKYDFLNHFLSFGIDKLWRKKTIRILKKYKPKTIIDIATGTADLSIETCKRIPGVEITGVDISEKMLAVGKEKIIKENLNDSIHLQVGDAEDIAFPAKFFDAATVAFGVRNFENLLKGLSEIERVLKDDGVLIVLEFSKPNFFLFKALYWTYFKWILPLFGRIISKDKFAYTYLPNSVHYFPQDEQLSAIFQQAGFNRVSIKKLTFGIATIYVCSK